MPNQFFMGQLVQSLTSEARNHIQGWMTDLNMLLSCFRENMTAAKESPQRISLSTDHIAIGMVGSSDIASNLLVGGFSESLLAKVGWEGYFPCVAAASAVTVIAATAVFPNYRDDVSNPSVKRDE